MGLPTRPASSGRYAKRALIPRDDAADVPPAITVGIPGGTADEADAGPHPGYLTMAPFDGWPEGWAMPWMEQAPTYSTFFGYGAMDPSGYLERVSTVGTCVDINARAVVAMAAYSVKDGVPGDLPDWYRSSPEPLEYADWTEFVGLAVRHLLIHGEAILWALDRYDNGYPSRFVALNPDRVTIDQYGQYHVTLAGGDAVQLDRFDVCHIRYIHDDSGSGRGIGPLAWAARSIVSAELLDRYASNLAAYGTSAVLTAPGDLTAAKSDQLRRDWARLRSANPGTPAVLSGGITYTPQSMSPRDMALLDLQVFDLQMVANAFGVPAGLAGLPQAAGGLTYSSPAMLRDQHWTGYLLPLCQRIAGALSNWLLPRGTRFEFNPDRYLQVPLPERMNAYATGFGIVDEQGRRAITVPEIRVAERFAPWDVAAVDAASADSVVGSTRG